MMRIFFLLLLFVFASVSRAVSVEEPSKTEGEVVFYNSLNNKQIVVFRDAFL